MQEYFEGTRIILNDDGSTTYVTYNHEPYTEPLTPKQSAIAIAVVLVLPVVAVLGPVGIAALADKLDLKRDKRLRQKRNREIYYSLPAS